MELSLNISEEELWNWLFLFSTKIFIGIIFVKDV